MTTLLPTPNEAIRRKQLNDSLTDTELATGVPIPRSVKQWLVQNTIDKEKAGLNQRRWWWSV